MILPRHVLCVLGKQLDLRDVVQVVSATAPEAEVDTEFFQREPDPRMPSAFAASLCAPTFTDADHAAVADHDTVVYVLSPPLPSSAALDTSARMLALVAALLRAGATAIKNESSGITHGRERWLELADAAAAATEPDERTILLRQAWVKRPIQHDGYVYSCGMHLLGAPEAEIADGTVEDVPTMDVFADYVLVESPVLRDGEGFRVDVGARRWIIEHHADTRSPEDDFFHNPYGAWRLKAAS